jgi:hypothetical protein
MKGFLHYVQAEITSSYRILYFLCAYNLGKLRLRPCGTCFRPKQSSKDFFTYRWRHDLRFSYPFTDPGVAKTANTLSFQTSIDTLVPASVNYFVIVGQKATNGLYRYPYALGLTKQGNALEAIELSVDLQAHTQFIAVGTPTPQALLHHNGTSAQQSAQQQNPLENKGGSSKAVPLSSGTHSVNFTIAWYDPLGIEVNALTDYLTFSYNGSTTS